MKKSLLALAAVLACGLAHAEDTLKKIKDSGAITLGVRESSGSASARSTSPATRSSSACP